MYNETKRFVKRSWLIWFLRGSCPDRSFQCPFVCYSGWQCRTAERSWPATTNHANSTGREHVRHGSSGNIQQQDRFYGHLSTNCWNDFQRRCGTKWINKETRNASPQCHQILGWEAQTYCKVSTSYFLQRVMLCRVYLIFIIFMSYLFYLFCNKISLYTWHFLNDVYT